MNASLFAQATRRVLASAALPAAMLAASVAHAGAVDLADKPLFSTTSVPGNLLLDLSVEYPTANTSAYFSTTPYANSTLYVGYFDGGKCYTYIYNSTTPTASYFQSYSTSSTSNHGCSSTAAVHLWSGNWLNYASMQGLDIFRWVLTGGNRSIDTTSMTILTRSTHSGQGGSGDAPNKTLSTSDQTISTPLSFSSTLNTRVWGAGIKLWFSVTGDLSPTTISSATDYQDSVLATIDGSKIYSLYMNVRVCDPTVSVESNCVLYGSTYKPEGLMQQYSQTLRYGAFGYLNDSSIDRDGGVLRARMAYIAPTQPVPGSTAITNPNPEWSSSTGVMVTNPDPSDATDTTTTIQGIAKTATAVATSGVMNYLNKFGYTSGSYKTYDPVSELYYASIRYLKGQSNVSSYTSMTGSSASTINTYVDGFPVINKWADVSSSYDPIIYSCQKNFVLGIGDVNTHHDANLPGSTLLTYEPAMPSEVSSDTTINVTTATNTVGTMEGTSFASLGTKYIADEATNFIAGIAYDAHVPISGHGLRSFTDASTGITTISTASTYWLDVLEYQTYVSNNQYYFTTKYGGFTVPSGYTYGTVPTLDSWYNSTNTQGSNKQPDNYFTAANATAMQAGLTSAFAKIVSENNAANGTSLALPTPNVTSTGAASYSASYDPSSWTGTVIGSTIAFAADGTPTATPVWDARALLSATTTTSASRKIVTCCTTSTTSPGLPFTLASLNAASRISRTDISSFTNVTGVATSSQSAANYIAYLRGDTSQETANGGAYRTRKYRLGDIVNSKPAIVGPPNFPYYDTYNPGYGAYKSKYASRKPVVYIGSNDGMVHAFDGTTGQTASGSELFGYIPSFVYGTSTTGPVTGLASLGTSSFSHHYLVDSTPGQFDVDLSNTYNSGVTAPNWHTLIIGGLGKGGKGYYAIDATDPTTYTDETTISTKILWEFTDPRMGYSYGVPTVVKTKKYGWVVVFTSGYTDADGLGYLFFVNPANGALLEAVATPVGSGTPSSPVDMALTTGYITNFTDMTADAIYAGDLKGDLWRFDVTAAKGSVQPYPSPIKLASLTDSAGNPQPVTTHVLTEVPPNSNTRYILVGTGKLLADSDTNTSQQQTFYAIIDGLSPYGSFYGTTVPLPTGVTLPVTRSQLTANTSLLNGIGSSPSSSEGWYFDLPVSSGIAQRVNVDPYATQGVVAFAGNLPNGSACTPSGTGTLYGVSYATGQTVLLNADLVTSTASQTATALIVDISIDNVGGNLGLYTGTSDAKQIKNPAKLTTAAGVTQVNWRDVPSSN